MAFEKPTAFPQGGEEKESRPGHEVSVKARVKCIILKIKEASERQAVKGRREADFTPPPQSQEVY